MKKFGVFIVAVAVVATALVKAEEVDINKPNRATDETCKKWKQLKSNGIPKTCSWMARKKVGNKRQIDETDRKHCEICHEKYPMCDRYCEENGIKFLIPYKSLKISPERRKMCRNCRKNVCRPHWKMP